MDKLGVSLAHCESKCTNFYDAAEVERVFYPEIEKLLLEFFPDATDALVYNHDVFDKDYTGDRTEDQANKNPGVNARYASLVHNDLNDNSGRVRCRECRRDLRADVERAHHGQDGFFSIRLVDLNIRNFVCYIDRDIRRDIRRVIEHLCDTENPLLNRSERERLIEEVLDETFGFGPLELLLKDPTISDILINGPHKIYVERRGKLELTDVTFNDDDHLMKVIDKIVARVGRRIDESSPMVDARLPDGSRVNAIIPPLALDGEHGRQGPLVRQRGGGRGLCPHGVRARRAQGCRRERRCFR